mmetsp:Transcript_9669/g.22062  ORF Transcript_9669/g.22062 Transcript_9669/m.22062 type:complete len:339 (-) Transcript_9669:117-1133(-)
MWGIKEKCTRVVRRKNREKANPPKSPSPLTEKPSPQGAPGFSALAALFLPVELLLGLGPGLLSRLGGLEGTLNVRVAVDQLGRSRRLDAVEVLEVVVFGLQDQVFGLEPQPLAGPVHEHRIPLLVPTEADGAAQEAVPVRPRAHPHHHHPAVQELRPPDTRVEFSASGFGAVQGGAQLGIQPRRRLEELLGRRQIVQSVLWARRRHVRLFGRSHSRILRSHSKSILGRHRTAENCPLASAAAAAARASSTAPVFTCPGVAPAAAETAPAANAAANAPVANAALDAAAPPPPPLPGAPPTPWEPSHWAISTWAAPRADPALGADPPASPSSCPEATDGK